MTNSIFVQLSIDKNCKLVAVDRTSLDTTFPMLSVEFILDFEKNVIDCKQKQIEHKKDILLDSTELSLKKDDVYLYNKILVPSIDTYKEGNIYKVANKCFYYEDSIYVSNTDITNLSDISNLTEITDLVKLIEIKKDYSLLGYEEIFVSMCGLKNCLLALQTKLINTCQTDKCSSNIDSILKRDFVLSTITVINYLITLCNYTEIHRILTQIKSCGNLCEDDNDLALLKNPCNCG